MIVRGGAVVTARGVEHVDIAIEGGLITDVGPNLDAYGDEIDATGLHVFPGGIDSHVHFDEPGRTAWETIADGSAALAAGGYTAFIDMPLNNLPVTTTAGAFDLKLAAMQSSSRIDFGLWGGLIPGNLDQLQELVDRGVFGFKAFMCPSGIDEFPACDERTLREGMSRISDLDSILLLHAEDPSLLTEPNGPSASDFLDSRPALAEIAAITRAIDIASDTGCRLHIVHVTTAKGADLIADAQASGVNVSGETCPHYLLYTSAELQRLGGFGKCAPPFRASSDQERLWFMQMFVSDHSPSTADLKQGNDFRRIWGGISGCQSTRQLLLAQDRLELWEIASRTSINIASRLSLEGKGEIAPGFDADLWLVDLSQEDIVRSQDLLYRNRFSVHEGQKIRGRTVKTLVRGMEPAPGAGQFIRPGERW